MPTFGTSAYLKLLALSQQPRDSELRKRILSTGGGGYDFHKAMRRIATEFAASICDWHATKLKLKAITKPAERKSATAATFALARWVAGRQIRLGCTEQKVLSPNGGFSIKFTPDFEIDLEGVPTQVHLWNAKKLPIKLREAIGTLGFFVPEDTPQSVPVLSLRSNELFVPTNYESARHLARLLALDIERRFSRIVGETSTIIRRIPPAEKRVG